jgi:2-methylisocitrate lyase-like PEP mutase family enzyme
VEEVGAPINILAVPGGLTLDEFRDLRVARVSFGSGLMHIAMDAAAQAAADYSAG